MNRVRIGFFSMSGGSSTGDDDWYFLWHQLDHMPEQYQLPGVVLGQRWTITPRCLVARLRTVPPFDAVRHLTLYLMGEPVQRTLDDFAALDRRLTALGRFPTRLPGVHFSPYQLLSAHTSPRVLISPEVVPWRPHRGAYVVVEARDRREPGRLDAWLREAHTEHMPAILESPGVAGAWVFGDGRRYVWPSSAPLDAQLTVIYLDGDPVASADALRPVLEKRWVGAPVDPLLAAPLETLSVGDVDGRR